MKDEYLDNNKPCVIIGMPNQAKTNLMVYFRLHIKRPAYILGYPKDLSHLGIETINSIDEIQLLHDCVLLIDEFGQYFSAADKKANEALEEALRFCEHNNIKLIVTTQNTQDITRRCESYFTQWAIKQVSKMSIKQGSKPSYILNHAIKDRRIGKTFIKIAVSEYVWYNELGQVGENGVYSFPNMGIGKAWCRDNIDNAEENTAEMSATMPFEYYNGAFK
jgi:hypothetical protein